MHTSAKSARDGTSLLSEATLIPVSFVLTLLGFAYWIATVAGVARQAATDVDYLRDQRQKYDMVVADRMLQQQRDFSDMKSLMSGLNAKVDMLVKEQDRLRVGDRH